MTADNVLAEITPEAQLRAWATRPPADDVKVATWDQLVADLLACIDALKNHESIRDTGGAQR